jgi:hypothetical protein
MDQSLVRPVMTCGTPVAFAAQFICLPRHLHFDISAGSLKCSVQTYCSAVPAGLQVPATCTFGSKCVSRQVYSLPCVLIPWVGTRCVQKHTTEALE